jgi:hypothetical protein
MGKKRASKAHRHGVAERCAEPAVHKRLEGDLALLGHAAELRRAIELSVLNAAQQPDATALSWLRPVPGSGEILSLGLRYAIHDIQRFPRGQACVSAGRLVTCAKEAAGKRAGTSGTKIGKASLQWACSAAAGLCRRANPAGQRDRRRLENTPGKGKAVTVVAHKLARAVYDMRQRHTAFEGPQVLTG